MSSNLLIVTMGRKTVTDRTLSDPNNRTTALPNNINTLHVVKMGITQIHTHKRAPSILAFLPT
jgi:hypothetical protein